jgi:PAS domain S-box-containing protein
MIAPEDLDRASTLDRCAQEPVHVIGQIQPHGMLFAISEPDLIVRQVSANVFDLLAMAPQTILNRSFEAVLGARQFEIFRSQTLSPEALEENPIRMQLAGGALQVQCLAHRQDGVLVVELELHEGSHSFEPFNLNLRIRLPLSRLELASGIAELSEMAAGEIRRISGFDRVMVYRFDDEWNGEVVAESAVPSPVSYLGLRFPAADIPPQARRLFLLNRLRAIVDIHATPVPIVPAIGPLTGRPLDLTCSLLRSPAQVHLEYLRNMGVQSSLTVSIIAGQQLWGMIACHHATPRHVDYSTRWACELFGQMLGSQVALRMNNAALQLQLASRGLLHSYLAQMDASASLANADQLHNHLLLELFNADGLIWSRAGVISTQGRSFEPAALLPVVGRLRELSSNGIASSNMLSALHPSAAAYASEFSGALYLGLGEETGDYLLLLRCELATTVTWAGNPDKSVNTDAQGRLHPRASFQAWQETVHARSRPWGELELECALSLREQLLQRFASVESALSKQRFRVLADTMPQLIWTAKPDGSVDYYNRRWVTYTGMSAAQSISGGWESCMHPADLSSCLDHWKRTIAAECDYEQECRIKRASDGAYRWHLSRAFPLRNHKGIVVSWVGTATDIEDQKQARQQLEREVAERTADLARSRAQLQTVLDGATNVAIIAANTAGVITLFNTGAENLLGYTSQELVGRQTPAIFHLESEMVARGLELTQEMGKPVRGLKVFVEKPKNGNHEEREWTYVRKDGGRLTVNLVVTALRDQAGTITGFLGVAMDMSARKLAEAASRASDEHFRLIVEAVEDYALIMLDTAGHVISWNVGAERIQGYKAGEIIGQHFSIFYPPNDIEKRHPDHELQIATKLGRYSEEGWRVRKDGARFLADVFITAVHDEAGNLRGFAKVVHDITERKRAEDQLNTAMRRLSLATSALHAGIWDWDIRTGAVVWDERMLEIYGLPAGTQATYPLWKSTVVPEDLPASEAVLQKVVASKSEASMEFRITLPNGSLRYIQAAEGVVLDDAGEVARVVGVNIDTTDRKFNEDLERQVAERTTQLKAANEELEQFAYVVAHDLKAPLRAIDNSAEWLAEDLAEHLTGETREHLKVLRSRVKRMDKLQDDLLEYAFIGRATDNRYAETIRGDLLMEDVLALLSPKGFTVSVSPSFAQIEVCRMPLQQILMNLIGNAIKHHHKKTGKITVTVEQDGGFHAFAVQDDGPGIGAPFHNQIFEMFRTLRPRDQVEGSGIGLAIVRKHIEIAGGKLQLESAEGKGSTFRFTWPIRRLGRKEIE